MARVQPLFKCVLRPWAVCGEQDRDSCRPPCECPRHVPSRRMAEPPEEGHLKARMNTSEEPHLWVMGPPTLVKTKEVAK